MLSSPLVSPRQLRQRPAPSTTHPRNMDEESVLEDSGFDDEDNDNLEHKPNLSDFLNATSSESCFTSRSADVELDISNAAHEPAEPVARKRAKKACDYCRSKKCKAQPNVKTITNVSAPGNLNAKSVGKMTNSATFQSIMVIRTRMKARRLHPSFRINISVIRGLQQKVDRLAWALKEYHFRMFAHLGPVAGPNHFTDVIPWLEHNPNTPPPQFLSDYLPNGNLEDGPARRQGRNGASNPFVT